MTVAPLEAHAAPHDTYRALLDERVLGFQACDACRAAVFPPRSRCPQCGADALSWHRSEGVGTVYATTVVTPRDASAYAVVLVDIDEGFRMMSRADDVAAHPIAIDDRVRVHFVEVAGELQPFTVATGDRA